jgi:hypothetical protein
MINNLVLYLSLEKGDVLHQCWRGEAHQWGGQVSKSQVYFFISIRFVLPLTGSKTTQKHDITCTKGKEINVPTIYNTFSLFSAINCTVYE